MNMTKRCWAEVSLDALLCNLNRIKEMTDAEILCVVKANAYGHGDEMVVRTLQQEGVRYFAVASMNEALHLRKSGCVQEILLLGGYLSDCFEHAVASDITLAVYDYDLAVKLSDYAVSFGKKAKVHIKLNTGMTRIGFDCFDFQSCISSVALIEDIIKLPGLNVVGAFTHFSVSDECDGEEYTAFQLENFNRVKEMLESHGINIPIWHTSNSGAIVNYPETHFDLVRAGIILYGMYNGCGYTDGFRPALSLKSVITQIRSIDAGTSISYGRTFVSDKKLKVATVSIGYADGYPRSMSNGGKMIVNGKFVPIVGRVCMDQTIVDVTDIECNVGDIVTVIGEDSGLSIDVNDIALADETINYEIICRLSPRIPRVYLKDNEMIGVTEYI